LSVHGLSPAVIDTFGNEPLEQMLRLSPASGVRYSDSEQDEQSIETTAHVRHQPDAGRSGRSMIMRKPAPLRRGDVIGIVAPGGAVDERRLAEGIRIIEEAGFGVRVGAAVMRRHGYLAGDDAARAADVCAMFGDPEVKGIIAARGGYGSGRLLPRIDPSLAALHPKIFVGHSDLTVLLNHFVERAQLVTFHGPMVAGFGRQPEGTSILLRMLSGERVGWHAAATELIQPGTAEGLLVGGCLSMLVALLGTPYAIPTRGRILFLEDVNEKPYRIDRMLTQLRHAGAFDEVAGLIFGEMEGCVAGEQEEVTVRDVVREAFATASFPVAFGLASGHGQGRVTLPLGVRVRLAAERLTLLESPLHEQ
jgi:muramoyltetrapeptide carboxypeptidase